MSRMRTADEVWRSPVGSPCELLLVDDPTVPLLNAALILPVGCLSDPEGKEGLAYLTGQMLTRGAGGQSREQIADHIDFLGASLGATVGRRYMTLSGEVLTRNLSEWERILSQVVNEPSFPEEELEKLKRLTIAEIKQVVDSDGALVQRHHTRTMFAGHPYGRPLYGTPESVSRITRDDVVAFYRQHMRRGNAFVAAAGDIDEARLVALASATLGRLPEGAGPHLPVPPPPRVEHARAVLVDKPERTQTQVIMGHTSVHARHADYMALHVANTYFGGTFTSKFTTEIREKRGWSYGASSYLSADRHLGTFSVRFAPAIKDAMAAISLSRELLVQLRDEGPTDEEVAFAKGYLINSHPFAIDTPTRQLNERLMSRLQGRPDSFIDDYMARVKDIDGDAVRAALGSHIQPDRLLTTVVCTAADMRPAMNAWAEIGDDATTTVAHDS